MSRLDLALLVHNLDATGGMERQARLLAERLVARGARARIVTNYWVDGVLPSWRPLERRGRLTVARLGLPRGWGYLNGLSLYELAAAAWLALRPPDVLYGIQWTGGVHALRVARVLERRVAVKLACGGVHGDMRTIHEAEDRSALATLRRADRVICLTDQIEAEARAEGFAPGQLVQIPNGVDLTVFGATPAAAFTGALAPLAAAERVLFVGALRAQKHLPSLLRAFVLLRESRPRARLLVAGEGEAGPPLEALARQLGVADRVHFLGRRADVPALLAAAHVFVLPSESEGLSNALLEALAAGAPVVASDIEGNRAVVAGERDALLVPLDDAPGLARAIGRILESPELAARLAAAGRARAREFALDSVAARYERELRGLARPRPSSARILARWLTAFENPGATGLAARGAAHVLRRAGQVLRARVDRTTIAIKRALGLAVPPAPPAPAAPAPTPTAPPRTSPAAGRARRRRRLGIAIVVYNIDLTGGMERQALRLAQELVARGARVWLISGSSVPGRWPRLPAGSPFLERRGRLAIHRVPLPRAWRWSLCTELYEVALAALLARHAQALDAIYAVQWTSGVHAERAARVLGRPFFVKFAGGGANGDFADMARRDAGATAIPALRRAAGLVCLSPQIESEARAAGLAATSLRRIPNGVDLARFAGAAPASLPGPADSERILFVGALRREKRIPDLVRAFAPVARARPRARLVLAGDGPEAAAILEAAREQGLEARVDLLGRRSDVAALLAAARAFVLTSESEGLSNALLEAMAAGAPIVATDIEGNRAVVEDEREALLVPLGDPAALSRALGRLLEDRALAARLGNAAREKAQRYSIERVAAEYEREFAAATAAARVRPGSGAIALRYFTRFGGAGLSGIALGLARDAFDATLRPRITRAVVALKRALGIEGDLLAARGRHGPR